MYIFSNIYLISDYKSLNYFELHSVSVTTLVVHLKQLLIKNILIKLGNSDLNNCPKLQFHLSCEHHDNE